MDKYELDGENYYFNNGKWLTASFIEAPTAKLNQLNKLLLNREDIDGKTLDQLIEILDGAKRSNNTLLALKAGKKALEIASVRDLRRLLPRICSTYRSVGQSEMAIKTARVYLSKYEKVVSSPVLFTSLAAAYCDIGQIETARKCANKAKVMNAGNSTPELINVYSRLKSLEH